MPSNSHAHAKASSDDSDQKSKSEIFSKTRDRRYVSRRQSSLPPSSDKFSYCWVSLENTHSHLQFPHVSGPSDWLQKKENNLRVSTEPCVPISSRTAVVVEAFE